MKPILEVQGIGKKYKISHQGVKYLSLREKVRDVLTFKKTESEEFWALRDISFSAQTGESIGIIGRNGAGKSTLLKILSKITKPTTGRITLRGRVASLLEVGTGFHPELTGRENVFLNGSLLGMKRREIEVKFDEIVDFSGVEKFLDTPLKHFSSGMQLRLAFAVAAFLEPEILIIDEVLAVGDAEFQRKCLGKMEDVSQSGRTIIFVSHDLAAVEKLCAKSILVQSGRIKMIADTAAVVNEYMYKQEGERAGSREVVKDVFLTSISFGNGRIESHSSVSFSISLTHQLARPQITEFCILIYTSRGIRVAILDFRDHLFKFRHIDNTISITGTIDNLNLVEGDYHIALHYGINDKVGEAQNLAVITVTDANNTSIRRYQPQYRGVMELNYSIDENG